MSNEIQKARDVLALWRYGSTPGQWVFESGYRDADIRSDTGEPHTYVAADGNGEGAVLWTDVNLIVGTAGNPELLDAIDAYLKSAADDTAEFGDVPGGLWNDAKRIAAAILAADERMRS